MAKHSPGPWSIHGDNKTLIGDKSGKMMVADVLHKHICPQWNRPLEEAQANARLIAAAPDLLATLLRCITDDNASSMDAGKPEYSKRRLKHINEIAREAIHKVLDN